MASGFPKQRWGRDQRANLQLRDEGRHEGVPAAGDDALAGAAGAPEGEGHDPPSTVCPPVIRPRTQVTPPLNDPPFVILTPG